MTKSFKDATSRHSANKNGHKSFSNDLYADALWAEPKDDLFESEEIAEEKVESKHISKSVVLEELKEFANEALDQSLEQKIIQSGLEIKRSKTPKNKTLGITAILNNEELKMKMVELEDNDNRFPTGLDEASVKIMFITKNLIDPGTESELKFENLNSCFEESAATLFERMMLAMKLEQSDFYISAIEDKNEESRLDLLLNEIAQVRPTLVLTLGAVATNTLLNKKERLSRIHGNFYETEVESGTQSIKLTIMPLFHPEYLLINPNMKKLAWEDMQKAMEKI